MAKSKAARKRKASQQTQSPNVPKSKALKASPNVNPTRSVPPSKTPLQGRPQKHSTGANLDVNPATSGQQSNVKDQSSTKPSASSPEKDYSPLIATALGLRTSIALLFMLTQVPSPPQSNPIPQCLVALENGLGNRVLSLLEEKRLVGVFTFLASTTKDPAKVAALCLEECTGGGSIKMRLAANHGDLLRVKKGFEDIAKVLKTVKSRSESSAIDEAESLEQMLTAIVSMNQNRIYCRMQSRHAKWKCNFAKTKASRSPMLILLVSTLRERLQMHGDTSILDQLDLLEGLTNSLESMKARDAGGTPGICAIIQILKVAANLRSNQEFEAQIQGIKVPAAFVKLAYYVSASRFLIKEASRNRALLALKVEIVRFQPLLLPNYTPSPQDLETLLASQGSSTTTSQIFDGLNVSGGKNGAGKREMVLCNRLAQIINAKSPVHAEIQLLLYYESNSVPFPPRIICSTKKACYLCNLFFNLHGKFHIPSTHGRLYEKWAVPAELQKFSGPQAESAMLLLERLSDNIVRECLNFALTKSRPERVCVLSTESFFPHQPLQMSASQLGVKSKTPPLVAVASCASSPKNDVSQTPRGSASPSEQSTSIEHAQETTPFGDSDLDLPLKAGDSVSFHVKSLGPEIHVKTKRLHLYISRANTQLETFREDPSLDDTILVSSLADDDEERDLTQHRLETPNIIAIDVDALLPGKEAIFPSDTDFRTGGLPTFRLALGKDVVLVRANRN